MRSHNSLVQTLVKASGKNSSTVFFLPKLSLSFTSTRPDACLDFSVKSGALVPTGIAIIFFGFEFNVLLWRTVWEFAALVSNGDFAKATRATAAKEVGQEMSTEKTAVCPDQKCLSSVKMPARSQSLCSSSRPDCTPR